jgi:hypothetical protein
MFIFFKTTADIFNTPSVVYEDYASKGILPPTSNWTYERELTIEEVDLWEIVYDLPCYLSVYASYCPYANFFLLVPGVYMKEKMSDIETYYGIDAQKRVYLRCKQLGINLELNDVYIDEKFMPKTRREKQYFV